MSEKRLRDAAKVLRACQCGCGSPTLLARKTESRRGHVKGEPLPFLPGHNARRPALDPQERFSTRVSVVGGCWQWTGGTRSTGYGHFWDGRRDVSAHRWSYEHHVGPVPDGLVLDHLCRNRLCVNPDHLEPVTNRENVLRGDSAHVINGGTCKAGHVMDEENTYHRPGTNWTDCRACHRDRQAKRRTK